MAKDLFGTVYVKGYFGVKNIPGSTLNKEYYGGLSNKIHFANITDPTYLPSAKGASVNSSWGYCEVVVTCTTSAGMPFGQKGSDTWPPGAVIIPGRLSIDPIGRIFLQFHLSYWGQISGTLPGTYKLDVNVPVFSYST
jgi:hypothetical protein